MKTFLFELCAETLEAAQAADRGGADRIELCERLDLGGITPGEPVTAAVIQALSIPVHVLIRPRSGKFVYTDSEFDQMRRQVQWAREAGAAGVALGVLQADGRIDVDRSRELAELARPMKVTFHRAFDRAPDLSVALEEVIGIGANCLLTSGGEPDVLTGAQTLAKLVAQAGDRIQIMAGGGLKLASMLQVLEQTGLRCLHGSLIRKSVDGEPEAAGRAETLETDVRTVVRLMRGHFAPEEIAAPDVR